MGGAVELAEGLLDGSYASGFAIGRPPGHHAERSRAMGFCLLNSIAVAAAHAVENLGCSRVLILDWDVHHGNGTQNIFEADPRVLFCSIHEWPLYPGSGHPAERGTGAGEGHTINLPVPAGSGDAVFCSLVEHVAVPVAERFEAELVLVSAGFDAHREDPLAGCVVTETGYARMSAALLALGVPVGLVLEGGYARPALARSVLACLRVLCGGPAQLEPLPVTALAAAAGQRLGLTCGADQ
ncbi:MAG: hypothetical protein NVSMB51_14460 [Solirubrobacteraceae bacterium]